MSQRSPGGRPDNFVFAAPDYTTQEGNKTQQKINTFPTPGRNRRLKIAMLLGVTPELLSSDQAHEGKHSRAEGSSDPGVSHLRPIWNNPGKVKCVTHECMHEDRLLEHAQSLPAASPP